MEKFEASIIENENRLFVEIPFNVNDKWQMKGLVGVHGFVYARGNKEEFIRKMIPKGKGVYYLPITKSILDKLGNPEIVTVEIEPIIKSDTVSHYDGFKEGMSWACEGLSVLSDFTSLKEDYYKMIFKRKSFHIFEQKYVFSPQEIEDIMAYTKTVSPLIPGIKVAFRIIPREETNCKRGEYCLLIYSEAKDNYLENAGYMGEQIDLYLESHNVGVCWYGMGSTKEKNYNDLKFVIMLAIEKVDPDDFRVDYTKAKRDPVETFWYTDKYLEIANEVRYTPSACNTQPWVLEEENNELFLYRVRKAKGMMPENRIYFYNRIDMGIFILFLELCFNKRSKKITLEYYPETTEPKELICKIQIN